jgi:hypothetical protein
LLAGIAGAAPFEEWNRTFRGAGNASPYSVQQTADGGYIFADRSLVKVNVNGNEQWAKTIGGTIYSVQGRTLSG